MWSCDRAKSKAHQWFSLVGDYRPGDILGGKYEVLEVMGRGSNGVTYKVSMHIVQCVKRQQLSYVEMIVHKVTGLWCHLKAGMPIS